MEVNDGMEKHLEFDFGEKIYVTGNGFNNTQGIFIAFQDNFLVWVSYVNGETRLLSTDTTGLTIAR